MNSPHYNPQTFLTVKIWLPCIIVGRKPTGATNCSRFYRTVQVP
jgi:hypothetical protein